MLDRDGYRPNVAIVIVNGKNLVFWGKRIREHSWQFPQGGINPGETPEQAMYRELHEEVGLEPAPRQDPRPHARLAALRGSAALDQARMARQLPRPEADLVSAAPDRPRQRRVSLRATDHPEFDAWRWHDYWIPLESVIEFKREVYRRGADSSSSATCTCGRKRGASACTAGRTR